MRPKNLIRILFTSSNPLKNSINNNLNSNVPDLSTNIVTKSKFNIPTISPIENIRMDHVEDYKERSHNDDEANEEDEEVLKALTAIFGFFYIGNLCYKESKGLKLKRDHFPKFKQRQQHPIAIKPSELNSKFTKK
jgi:hypothetical protein